jgi:hypothetical protein
MEVSRPRREAAVRGEAQRRLDTEAHNREYKQAVRLDHAEVEEERERMAAATSLAMVPVHPLCGEQTKRGTPCTRCAPYRLNGTPYCSQHFKMASRRTTGDVANVHQSENNTMISSNDCVIFEPGQTCGICFVDMREEAGITMLNCGHLFHPTCIRQWFARESTCPFCRRVSNMSRGAGRAHQRKLVRIIPTVGLADI